jgi:hypothetical protein
MPVAFSAGALFSVDAPFFVGALFFEGALFAGTSFVIEARGAARRALARGVAFFGFTLEREGRRAGFLRFIVGMVTSGAPGG